MLWVGPSAEPYLQIVNCRVVLAEILSWRLIMGLALPTVAVGAALRDILRVVPDLEVPSTDTVRSRLSPAALRD